MVSKIEKFRVNHDKSQEEVAIIMGCSPYKYNLKEKGLINFTVEEIRIFKAYFNLSIEETWDIFFEE